MNELLPSSYMEPKRAVLYLCIVAAVLIWPAAAGADPHPAQARGEILSDIQCVIVGARLSESSDGNQRLSAGMLMIYYLGRIDGGSPNSNIGRLIEDEAAAMTSSEFKDATRRCSAQFSAKGTEVEEIGRSLARLGR